MMKLLSAGGCLFPAAGGNETITDYDSRRTGDWFSDRGSIPLRSIKKPGTDFDTGSIAIRVRLFIFFKLHWKKCDVCLPKISIRQHCRMRYQTYGAFPDVRYLFPSHISMDTDRLISDHNLAVSRLNFDQFAEINCYSGI